MREAAFIADHSLLYHYTSEDGLLGIIEHDNIWATHVRYLNDYTEFREAFQERFVGVLMDSFLAGLPEGLDRTARPVIEGVLSKRNVPQLLKGIESSGSTNETFVCSFVGGADSIPQSGSNPGDRLSQWRGYSHSSQGFSLGFDRVLLEKQIRIDNSRCKRSLHKCIYEDNEKSKFFQEMGRKASDHFANLTLNGGSVPEWFRTNRPDAPEEYKRLNSYFLLSLAKATADFFTAAAQIKDCGFGEECEWRIVSHRNKLSPEIVKFRKGQFGLTPFIEVPLSLTKPEISSLRRIVVGPSAHKEDIKHSVELLLQKHGIQVRRPDTNDGVMVRTSLIPYRSA